MLNRISNNKRSKRICIFFLISILLMMLFLGYGSYTSLKEASPFSTWILLVGYFLVVFGGLLSAWSGFRLWPKILTSTKANEEIYKKVKANETLTENETQQYNYNEMLRVTFKCNSASFFLGLIILILYSSIN